MNFFKNKITSEQESKLFFHRLDKHHLMFHPEDDPSQIVALNDNNEHEELFTEEQCIDLRLRIDEIFEYMNDPCLYIVENIYKD
jgi:hypothetical protein